MAQSYMGTHRRVMHWAWRICHMAVRCDAGCRGQCCRLHGVMGHAGMGFTKASHGFCTGPASGLHNRRVAIASLRLQLSACTSNITFFHHHLCRGAGCCRSRWHAPFLWLAAHTHRALQGTLKQCRFLRSGASRRHPLRLPRRISAAGGNTWATAS